jgi:hypothetical protein
VRWLAGEAPGLGAAVTQALHFRPIGKDTRGIGRTTLANRGHMPAVVDARGQDRWDLNFFTLPQLAREQQP